MKLSTTRRHAGPEPHGGPPPRALAVLLTLAFIIAYTQYPLYFSNQNAYFIHGLADAGYGLLADDWLARTTDAFPVFSALVRVTLPLGEWPFYVYYAAILGLYLWTATGIGARAAGIDRDRLGRLTLAFALLAVHSSAFEYLSVKLTGINLSWVLQMGVAGQYILGPVFQPSVFGVLLLLAVHLHLMDRPRWAVVAAGVGATVHPSYLLPAAILTGAFMLDLWLDDRRPRRPLTVGLLALAVVTPIVIYALLAFEPATAPLAERAREILVEERFPHHARPGAWLDAVALAQIALLAAALALTRGHRLFRILAFALAAGTALTLAQVLTDSRMLALLFPWRISALLVPIATAVLLGRAVAWLFRRPEGGLGTPPTPYRIRLAWSLAALSMLAIVSGVLFWRVRIRGQAVAPHADVARYVRETASPGDLYLIPDRLGEFRLEAAAPVFIDWNAHPYRDIEVLEWFDRIRTAQAFYAAGPDAACAMLEPLRTIHGVTHVVLAAGPPPGCPALERVYDGPRYHVYEVAAGGSASDRGSPIADRR